MYSRNHSSEQSRLHHSPYYQYNPYHPPHPHPPPPTPPPVDRLYNWCQQCEHHWDLATKPRCICVPRPHRSSASWTTKFISSIPSFTSDSSNHSARRSNSPPLRYDEPMMTPVQPSTTLAQLPPAMQFTDPYIGLHKDPFSASPNFHRGHSVPPLPNVNPPVLQGYPVLGGGGSGYPYPSYPLSDSTYHPDSTMPPSLQPPRPPASHPLLQRQLASQPVIPIAAPQARHLPAYPLLYHTQGPGPYPDPSSGMWRKGSEAQYTNHYDPKLHSHHGHISPRNSMPPGPVVPLGSGGAAWPRGY